MGSSNTGSAQISTIQNKRNIYVCINTTCVRGHNCSGFIATDAVDRQIDKQIDRQI